MKSKPIKKSLICILTDKERREYGIQLATTLGDMDAIESEKKEVMDNYKNRLAGMQAKVDELATKTKNGKEWRDVDCHVLYGTPDKEHKQTIRIDTGETVATEIMTEADLQLVMPLEDDLANDTEGINDAIVASVPHYRVIDADGENVMIRPVDDGDGFIPGPLCQREIDEAVERMGAKGGFPKVSGELDTLIENYGDEVMRPVLKAATIANLPKKILDAIRGRAMEVDPDGDY